MAKPDKPIMGKTSERWWAQQAIIEAPEVPVEAAVIALAWFVTDECLIMLFNRVNKPTWTPNPKDNAIIQYQSCLNCETVADKLSEEIVITKK